ncbi:MAG: c-type cytochrome [Cytophagaceae bacterium]|jgi:mono/diheme cytochrome c family protein|nr:c-type cytochrome [Cytophagaceae bacterium]
MSFRALKIFSGCFLLVFLLNSISVFAQADLANGKELFEGNCTACHAIHKDKVGPALKDIKKRRDLTWIKKFIRNSQNVIKVEKDPYAVALYAKYNNTEMTAFPSFKDNEIENIVAYIMDESVKTPAGPVPTTPSPEGQPQVNTSGGNDTLILILTVITLVLVAVTLIVFLTVIRRYLKDREDKLADEDKEIVNQGFDVMAVLRHKAFIIVVSLLLVGAGVRSLWVGALSIGVEQNYAPKQPIPFSHKLHAGNLKIDCGYCHTGVYRGKQANIPGVNICMNCHSAVKEGPSGKENIAALVEAYNNKKPIQWVRVHNLPDLSYFNHSQHTVAGGIECVKCHGEIDTMSVVRQASNLTMGWCINCHRETSVNGKDNAYYDRLLKFHEEEVKKGKRKGEMKAVHIGGTECSKCHY